jgi:hypothetical protein
MSCPLMLSLKYAHSAGDKSTFPLLFSIVGLLRVHEAKIACMSVMYVSLVIFVRLSLIACHCSHLHEKWEIIILYNF